MDLFEEQIEAHKNMIKYHESLIRQLERKRKHSSNVSRDSDGKIFSDGCCFNKPGDRIYLTIVNKHKAP